MVVFFLLFIFPDVFFSGENSEQKKLIKRKPINIYGSNLIKH